MSYLFAQRKILTTNQKMTRKYPYDYWFFETIKEDRGFSVFSWPLIGWTMAIAVFGFYYPIKYLLRRTK